jgi:Dolichyl-phosphate-mannose-protein mannosyltransferase
MKKSVRVHIISLVALSVIVHFLLFARLGIRHLNDSAIYIFNADFIIEHGALSEIRYLFYSVPIFLLAFFRWLFDNQLLPFLIFQCIVSTVSVLFLYGATSKVFNTPLAGCFSGLIFLCWWDNIQWNTTVMTESLFGSFACMLVYHLSNFNNSARAYGWVAAWLTGRHLC